MEAKKSKLVKDNTGFVRLSNEALKIARDNKDLTGTSISKFVEDAILEKSGNGNIANAIDILRKNFKDKSEGSYYYSWQANIAMSYLDNERWYRDKKKKRTLSYKEKHEVANKAAKYFLDLLVKQ